MLNQTIFPFKYIKNILVKKTQPPLFVLFFYIIHTMIGGNFIYPGINGGSMLKTIQILIDFYKYVLREISGNFTIGGIPINQI